MNNETPLPQGQLTRGDSGHALFVLHKASNGWIVSDSQYVSTSDVPELKVFTSMRDLAAYLVKAVGEKPKIIRLPQRDSKGHFLKEEQG